MSSKLGRNEMCWCGSGKKYKACHERFDEKLSLLREKGYEVPPHDIIKTREQIEGIKESSKINIAVLDKVGECIQAGMSTEEIDRLVYDTTTEMGGIPAPLGYEGFPKSVCTSVNNQVCHGIPSDRDILKDGQIINVDVSTCYKGYYSDSSRMYLIGEVSDTMKRLVEVTRECLDVGLGQVVPFAPIGNVGAAIHEYAKKNGYTVVEEIGGHGIGLEFHEEPFVSFVSKWDTGMIMAPGMVFTIEPMVNMGASDIFIDSSNGWTAYTRDNKPSAQWEITVHVTEDGPEILTY